MGVKALLEVGFLQLQAGRGQAEHDCQQLPSLPGLCIYYIFQLRAINSNSTSAEKKKENWEPPTNRKEDYSTEVGHHVMMRRPELAKGLRF